MPGEYTIAGGLVDAQRLARQAHVMAEATDAFLTGLGLAPGWSCRRSHHRAAPATKGEVDALVAGLERAARDPATVFHQARIHQVSGRRPA